ncbi:MAG: hypothetical protein IT182_18270 [Acidobacteria bacterium]|nr:hypothetical protein [Acidobacteriota bacterium]
MSAVLLAAGVATGAVVAVVGGSVASAHHHNVMVQAETAAFERDVVPIFKETCVECHGPTKAKGRLRMDSVEALQKGGRNGALIEPGDPEKSLLMRRVLGLDGDDRMPLEKDPLTDEQIDTLRKWIAAGARY